MASINDYGKSDIESLAQPKLGGTDGWAAAVAAALDGDDTPVGDRFVPIAAVGAWQSYAIAPVDVGPFVAGNAIVVGRYRKIGTSVRVHGKFTIGSTTQLNSATGIFLTAPITPYNPLSGQHVGHVYAMDVGANAFPGTMFCDISTAYIALRPLSMTTGALTPFTSSYPFAWQAGDYFAFDIEYESAS